MRDRLSTKILSNGATRYGVYDETGNLLRYEYIKLEDEPTVEGDLFSKANMLPDSIPAALGLKMGNPQVKDALNVLANIGNVHVWERVQTVTDPIPEVPAGYTLGEVEENVVLASRSTTVSTNGTFYYYYGDSVTVKNDGTVNAPSSDSWAKIGRNVSATTLKSGPLFVKGSSSYISSGSGYQGADVTNEATKVFYIPSGGTLSVTVDSNAKMCYVVATKYQPVTGYPYTPAIPAGTHTDYLTSTDRNAYPDQSAEGGQDASYVLGDVVSGSFGLGRMNASTNMTYKVSDSIDVLDDGTIVMNDSTVVYVGYGGASTLTSVQSSFLGKFVCRINDGDTTHDSYTKLPKDEVVYIPSDAIITSEAVSSSTVFNVDQYQPVTGYPAIPANTVITYLGQLGEPGAKIEVGSYVGTGTYGQSNPNSLTFGFEPKLLIIRNASSSNEYLFLSAVKSGRYVSFSLRMSGGSAGSYTGVITLSGNIVSWYADDSQAQMNLSDYTFHYIALG